MELSDFNREGLEVEVAALFEAGGAGSDPALYSASGSRWTESGSLVDGQVLLGEGSSIVRVMLPESDGSLLRLNHDGPLVLRDYFGSSGDGADLTVWIQTAQGAVSFAASDVRTVGSSYVNFNVPQATRSALSGIASGDQFILALTRPAPAPEPTPEPTETPTPEPTVAPGKITGLTMTSSRPGHLWVSWNASVPAPTEYRLNWAPVDDPFPAWNSNQGGNLWLSPRTAQDFSNIVEAGVTYQLRMRAIYKDDPEGNWAGDWSDVMTKRVRNHPPSAPTNLSAGSITYDGLTLNWNALDHNGLTGYRILRGTSADALEILVADTGNLGRSYTDTPDGYDKTYHYAVIALSLDGNSPQSATVSATTLARPQTPDTPVTEGAPVAPSGLTASLDGAGGVSLSWTDPNDDGITGYRVLRGDDAQSMRIISENTGSASVAYLDASSRVNRTHVYAVQARNATGLSQLSNTVSVTPLGAPTNLSAGSITYDGLTLNWNAPDHNGLTGYKILRGINADALETLVADTGHLGRSYTDTPDGYDKTYHYAVIALSLDGNSPQSATVSATTLARPQTPDTPVTEGAPAAPSGLTASLDGAGGVSLSWTDPNDDGITGYRVLRGDDAQSMRIISENTGSASVAYLDASSRVNRTHVYAVQARNATGLSQLSNTVSVTPLGAPTNLLAANSPNSEVSLNWTAPSTTGVTGYHILRGPSADALSTLVADTGATATTYTDTTAKADTTYHYTVGAIGPHGEGPSTVNVSVTVPPAPQIIVPREPEVFIENEPLISLPQEDDPCAPEIESVGGSASNGNVQWKWKSVAPPAPAAGVDGCENRWVDFRLSYSDDYGATFTGAEVVRGYIHNTDSATITIGDKEFNRNEEYHSASTPELSIVSKLRVEVGCDAAGANCAHSLDSTAASFKPYYSSRSTGRHDGASTEALLAPANYCTDCWGNASVIGWLDIGEDPHTYRIHMTAGKTYVFDETYRKWALTSGEWRGGPHFYLPDEFRLSLYTKNSAGELVAVSDFQNQPEHGWQAIHEDWDIDDDNSRYSDYQRMPDALDARTPGEFFEIVKQTKLLFDNAHFFPPGSRHRHPCVADPSNICGQGLDIYWYDGRQLRNASYTPTKTGVYYLTVTRTADEQPVWRDGNGYSITMLHGESGRSYISAFQSGASSGEGMRNAMPYYELSVEVRGPTLSSIRLLGDIFLDNAQEGRFGFLPGRFEYNVGLFPGTTEISVHAVPALTDATVAITPTDANSTASGHQIRPADGEETDIVITVTHGDATETYTVTVSKP